MGIYNQLLSRLIEQLDSLISFLGLSHKEVFTLLRRERIPWFGSSAKNLPDVYVEYRKQVTHSAFLLGYSYFESFLTDMLKEILVARPAMLPEEKVIPYKDILNADSKDDILSYLVKREIHELLYKSMRDIVNELKQRYGFAITTEQESELCKASLIRNCILHNSSCADARLAEQDGFQEGNT